MSAIQLAGALGAREIYAVDIQPEKLVLAASYGAIPINPRESEASVQIRVMDARRIGRFHAPLLRHTGALHTLAMLVLLLAMLLQAGCASLPTDYPRSPSTALTDTGDTRLGQTSSRLLAEHPGVSGVLLLNRGTDAFLARLALAEIAQRSLDIQYYIWHGDTTGKVPSRPAMTDGLGWGGC